MASTAFPATTSPVPVLVRAGTACPYRPIAWNASPRVGRVAAISITSERTDAGPTEIAATPLSFLGLPDAFCVHLVSESSGAEMGAVYC
jgi:hypothetical protein